MIKIELHVLWLPDDLIPTNQLGIEIPLDKCTTKIHTFYNINGVRPHEEKGYCEILVNGDVFTVKETYENVTRQIEDQLNFKWN
ncbi:hypothetical protein [Flavobacterium sp. GNP002]